MSPDDKHATRHPVFPQGEEKASHVEHVELVTMLDDEPTVVVTRALCPMGHDLVLPENPTFDGHRGIALMVKSGDRSGLLYLSPVHGDMSKQGYTDFEAGDDCEISCPVCGTVFPVIGRCSCEGHGKLYAVYLSPILKQRNVVGLCSIWGCPRSRVMDNWEIVSEIALQEADEADQ